MTSKATLAVVPSEERVGLLTVPDALRQAADFFDLLAEGRVVWKLDAAFADGRFVCRGEPVDVRTKAGAAAAVREHVEIVARNFRRVAEGEGFDDALPADKIEVAERMLRRIADGTGESVVTFFDGADEIGISRAIAQRHFDRFEGAGSGFRLSATTRQEIGSVEGHIERIGTYRGQPALLVRDRNTLREVWCGISEDMAETIGDEMRAREVWRPRRVYVHGTLNCNDDGEISSVIDATVECVEIPSFDLDLLKDKDFTEGYSPREYLDRLHEDRFDD